MTEDGGDTDYRYDSSDLSEDDYEESEEEQEDPSDYCKGIRVTSSPLPKTDNPCQFQ